MSQYTVDEYKSMIQQAAVLVQGEESYRIDFTLDDEFQVTDEDSGEEYMLAYTDINDTDLIYGFKLLNSCKAGVDWELLRTQKEWLLNNGCDTAMGLVHLLDMLQDDAVEGGISKDTVFGNI